MPRSEPGGYSRPVARYIEDRLTNRVETPDELLEDIAKTLTTNHGMAAYEYEERYIDIHHPVRVCPGCGEVRRLQVVVNRDTEERTRHCGECEIVVRDEHLGAEARQIMQPIWQSMDIPFHINTAGIDDG